MQNVFLHCSIMALTVFIPFAVGMERYDMALVAAGHAAALICYRRSFR
jgi:hypothetical protein